jgi:hypothetical protein
VPRAGLVVDIDCRCRRAPGSSTEIGGNALGLVAPAAGVCAFAVPANSATIIEAPTHEWRLEGCIANFT